ncbi:class I SAM-dependent methyltransferase [Verrucomicrobium spinosum]|uniref:class I SAM-dependent methyltransferase n=1 Tax=Verrucomicrobium spinosum TaxID=2736 RepID=UPI00155DBE35|nr:methyltransferase domain-containing protein [Verrucomicrobium spinosum]
MGENGSELYQQVVIPGALALLKPQAGESILDLGCGQGVFSRALTAEGAKVTGVDAAPSLIKRAKTYPSPAPIRYVARDAAKLNDLAPSTPSPPSSASRTWLIWAKSARPRPRY